ncbi:MAG TPA: ATP-dependent zinc metalloprotease FtsH [Sedimentibacter sp.]|jgi:cell division protease FtsH|nr:ATP-dependent zinc metalloprotease FtsH [Sedimentibacter sp.]HPB79423.1 ATP-dependent zinc metalloprotease FtsH [Sedimentibacter sp.]HPV85591.1 ATP-dependent zinc metalloprotease FtsH [Sedimentibacter sp.]HPY56938.1 ATP-dependent zinc metalloprotease FtsH [Sedimentibacter sp.]HQO72460.1 ATP-dependent zinc metalloprotease FtsH [Sedimentibacter sp.]
MYILIFVVIIMLVQSMVEPPTQVTSISYSDLVVEIQNDNVKTLTFTENEVEGIFKDGKEFTSYIPSLFYFSGAFYDNHLVEKIEAGEIEVIGEPVPPTPLWLQALPTIGMLVLLGVLWYVFMKQSQGGGTGKAMSFGKSRARMVKDDEKKITFADVAGLDEEKEELSEIVDFLKNPAKFVKLGARIPKGVLLVGPPGTGKTYLSKSVSGEAGVPFFSISGSDFVEMFVGVGASRVRDLFDQAKKNAPCIVFIDEIDAVGRRRGAGLGGGNDEREQTLNQLLVEMDGFSGNEGIIIIAATNRPDILDPALMRPGRFDRQVHVGLPDVKAREEILKIHVRKKPLGDDVNLEIVAKRTPGFTPADLENAMNEAALLTARQNKTVITMDIIEEAITKVIAGPEKRSKVISDNEKKLTAYHEAGHAVVAKLSSSKDPVHMITIIPRGGAGGFTMYLPEEDKSYRSKSDMEEYIVRLLGGRVAEKLALDDISTGASNDIERATKIARAMVTTYGMSDELGPMSYGTSDDEVFLGRDFNKIRNYSEDVAAKIDREMRRIIDNAYNKTEKLLSENIEKLHRVAQALLEKETITGKEFEILFDGGSIS